VTALARKSPTGDAYVPDVESPTLAVEVKRHLAGARGLRDALALLAGFLAKNPGKHGVLLLLDPRITTQRVHEEQSWLGEALRAKIADRLRVIVVRGGHFEEKQVALSQMDWGLLEQLAAKETEDSSDLPRPDLQSEVLRVLVLQWLRSGGPVTSRWLQETVGCNYRTVAAALGRLGSAVKRYSSRQVELKYFPKEEWMKLLATSDSARATRRYADRSDQPRSPESLLRRLRSLKRSDLAVGGVLGARHYYADLDLIGTPRLDVCVHSPEGRAQLDFVRRLDPALQETSESDSPARLVLHFVRREESLFEEDPSGLRWADPVECLLDLHEMRFEAQAAGFVEFLTAQRVAS